MLLFMCIMWYMCEYMSAVAAGILCSIKSSCDSQWRLFGMPACSSVRIVSDIISAKK